MIYFLKQQKGPKMHLKLLTLLLLTFSFLFSAEALTKIELEKDKDDNTNPNILLQLIWSNNYYSYIGYKNSSSKEINSLYGFSDSKNAFVSSRNDVILNWLTREINNYSIGIQTDFIKIENNEFGYIHDTSNTFNQGNDYWIAYDNEVDIDVTKTSLYLDYHKKLNNNIFLRASSTISLDTKLKVKQSTLFKPLVNKTGLSSSTTSQDTSYTLKFESFYDTKELLKFGFVYSYEFMPLEYDIAQIAYNNNSFSFQDSTIKSEEITTKYRFKIYLDYKVLDVLYPGITIGQTKIKTKDKISGDSSTQTSDIIGLTLQRWF